MCNPMKTPLALALLLLATAGCGRDRAAQAPALDGPPRWRLVREEGAGEGTSLTLQARAPVDVRFRVDTTGREAEITPWRTLAAGQVLRIAWSHFVEPREDIEDAPAATDLRAGRTDPHALGVRFQYADRAVHFTRLLAFTRPGTGQVAMAEALPPGKYEDLPLPGRVELLTALVSDLQAGQASLRRRELEGVVVRPAAESEGDRVHVLRLFLEFAPTSPR